MPLGLRVTAVACGLLAFVLVRRSLFVGAVVGAAMLLAGGFLMAH